MLFARSHHHSSYSIQKGLAFRSQRWMSTASSYFAGLVGCLTDKRNLDSLVLMTKKESNLGMRDLVIVGISEEATASSASMVVTP